MRAPKYKGALEGESKERDRVRLDVMRGLLGRASIAMASLVLAGASTAVCSGDTPPATRWGTVRLPSGAMLNVEIADTPLLLQRGYMFRETIPDGEGMLFFMGTLGLHSFWMKNCLTALDIIWMDEQWRIVDIAPKAPPCKEDPCPLYAPMRKSLYVLEVGPGSAARLGLKLGDPISFIPPSLPSR